ncbi:cell wall protein RBR3-like [Cucumis melo var. makuwa]|uniref:Cell wall protein RBR3-like n=1 Tax=Cucumis melo var. makuwa TaxID=1194695 RepID=A0A5D3DEX9_CUCMM|nr:cell wall protein RBR3-like [Cucumis melo var. makuwa]TYK22095.1 cell wall protein RBR3-like [Cucumis melo var. makuwa]
MKGPRVVTTKTGHRTLPPDIPSVPVDGILFHLEKSVQHWKYVVQRRIVDEVNISDKYHSGLSIMDLIVKAGLSKTILNFGPFYPSFTSSNDELASILSDGTLSVWPVNGISAGSHVPDLDHDMRPSRNPRTFDTEDVNISSEGLTVPHDYSYG